MIDLPAATLELLQAEESDGRPQVVDFWAPWCGSCRLLAPSVMTISEEVGDRATFLQVDVDAFPDVAERLGVMSVPTILVFKDGHEVARSSGMKSRQSLYDDIAPFLA